MANAAAPELDGMAETAAEPSVAEERRSFEPRAEEEADETAPESSSPSLPDQSKSRRTRTPRTFPASSFMEALSLGLAIQKFAAGQKVRRLTLFDQMGRSADSGTSRQLVTNSSQYGITKGGFRAEFLELTENGRLATGDDSLGRARMAARMQLAIAEIPAFNGLYEQFSNNRLPAATVMADYLVEEGLTSRDNADECVGTFLANARDLGLLTNYAGAERLLTFEIVLDELQARDDGDADEGSRDGEGVPADRSRAPEQPQSRRRIEGRTPAQVLAQSSDLSDVCFFVTPIGADGSPQRQHADLMLGSLIEPSLDTLGLRLVRADQISKPGMITGQIIEHLVRAPLVIADLSFGNPNVFYELALRHASRKPAVQLIRAGDHLPFDVGQFRTVTIDMTSIYTLVPQLDTYRAEIARQCRAALDAEGEAESPLSLFFPRFWEQFS